MRKQPKDAGPMTVRRMVAEYVKDKTPCHAAATERVMSFFPPEASINTALALAESFRDHLLGKGLKPATVVNYIGIAEAVFGYAFRKGWTDQAIDLEKPRVKIAVKALRDSEVDALIAAADIWLRPHLVFLRNTGLRIGELLCLKRQDVDVAGCRAVIRDTKNGEDRIIPLNGAALKVIEELPYDGILFRDRDGKPFLYSKDDAIPHINRFVAAAAKRAGIRHVTPHMLRHTFATRLVEAGAPLPVIQALGGWKTPDAALRYAKADLRVQNQYANMISMGTAV